MLATRIDDDYTRYDIGDYMDLGLAALLDITWDGGFGLLAGLRHDTLQMRSRQPVEKLLLPSARSTSALRRTRTACRPRRRIALMGRLGR